MRAPILLAVILAAGPAPAQVRPAPGWYCPSDGSNPIAIDVPSGRVSAGIDGMECPRHFVPQRQDQGCPLLRKTTSPTGSPYETDLFVREDGTIAHDGKTFRKYSGRMPCP